LADSIGSDFHSPQPNAAASAGAPHGVGATLRAAREALGLSRKDIAERTRITARHVEALEAGDYDTLPGRPYALGFARSYAKAVGLDEAMIADAVRAELGARAPAPEPRVIHQFEAGDPAKTPSRLISWLAGLLVVAVLGLGLVFWRSYYWPSAELPALVGPEEPRPAAPAAAAKPAPAAPAARPNGPVVFTAQEDRIWVKFYDGSGKQLVQKLLAKGETYTVPDGVTDPKLWTGRPDALAITIGGQAVPRLADKQGIVKDVAVDAAALWAHADRAAAQPTDAPDAAASPASVPAHRLVRRRAATGSPAGSEGGSDGAVQPTTTAAAPDPAAATATN
jgi:transcriptional regulator with XRE-family HTH domain